MILIATGLVTIDGNSVSKLADFTHLSSQLAKATPSSTAYSDYTVTNTAAQSCPTVNSDWAASSNLPPIASSELCSCMVKSLSCVADSDLSSSTISEQFSYVCGLDSSLCDGINGNATTGEYGAYTVCTSSQQLSFAYNQYYLSQSKASTACDFSGNAKTQSASTAGTCSSLLSEAGTAGTGTVTSNPTGSAGSTGTGSSSSSTSTKTGAAGALVVPRFDVGILQLGAYVVAAGMAGVGMILL
jgi:hypothetical protein